MSKIKSFFIVGAGAFGYHLTKYLSEKNCEILLVDKNEKPLEPLLPYATSARIADCTDRDALLSFDVASFDACFVCVDSDFEAALEITCLLKELGAKKVFSNADRDIRARLLKRNGADVIIYPEKDIARRLAVNESSDSIFDSFELTEDYSVYEISVPAAWVGKTIRQLNVRAKYSLNILAEKKGSIVTPIGDPEHTFAADSHILVMGTAQDIGKVIDR